MFSFMAETFWPFYKNFQGFTYCSVFKVLCCSCLFSATASIVYHAAFCLSRTFLNFFLISFRNPWVSFRSLSRSLGTGIRIPDVLPNVNIFFHFFCVFHVSFFCSFYIYKIRRHILCRTQDMPLVLFTGCCRPLLFCFPVYDLSVNDRHHRKDGPDLLRSACENVCIQHCHIRQVPRL